ILFTNATLEQIEQWPMASIQGIWVTWWESLLFYALVVVIALAVMVPHKRWVYGALGCVALMVCGAFSKGMADRGREAIVFNVRRNLGTGFVEQGQAWLYTALPSMDDRTIGYSVRPALEARAAANQNHFMAHDSVYHDQFTYA